MTRSRLRYALAIALSAVFLLAAPVASAYPVDLDALWASLGVTLENQQVVYNDAAPMAHIRKRLLKSVGERVTSF